MKLIFLKSKWYLLFGSLATCIFLYSCTKNFDKVNNILTVFGVKFGLSKEKVGL